MKISVVIITYKVEAYLRQCLESVLAQTFRELEVIIVLGQDPKGEDDGCLKIAEEYRLGDERIKIVECVAAGVSDARNRGLRAATGELIGFVDADDHIEPDMYEHLLELMLKEQADIAVCGRFYEFMNTTRSDLPYPDGPRILDSEAALTMVLKGDGFYLHSWDKLYRRELWDGIEFPEDRQVEDRVTIDRVLGRAGRIVYDPTPRYHYRERRTSMSKSGRVAFNNYIANEELSAYIKENFPSLKQLCDRYMIYETITALQNVYLGAGAEGRAASKNGAKRGDAASKNGAKRGDAASKNGAKRGDAASKAHGAGEDGAISGAGAGYGADGAGFYRAKLLEMRPLLSGNPLIGFSLKLKYLLAICAPGILVMNTRLRNKRIDEELVRFD